uniref:Translin associated factor X n=1 Tax=Molossus molossus TaxID=27622 RepID=A0A7J8BP95_MOLMO|nr:translin associated factor X [Molossus molossus]
MVSDKRYCRWPRSSQEKTCISSTEPLRQDYRNMWKPSLFNTLSKHDHLSVWMKSINNWYLQQKTMGQKIRL